MRKPLRASLSTGILAIAMAIAGGVPAAAQIPDEFTNLKLLPKDIGRQELVSIMRDFAGALGKRCDYCHVGKDPEDLRTFDFASDDKEHKRIARAMMQMVGEINGKLLPAAGIESPTRVRCVTCHRGVDEPETLDRILLEEIESGGVEAAAARYRELRQEYYGSGSYDFGSVTFFHVAETLAREKGDVEGAIELMQLDLEHHPEAVNSHLMLAQLYAQKGDDAAARASIERALKLEPDNAWAKQLLERVKPRE